jgi:hypothetical protein
MVMFFNARLRPSTAAALATIPTMAGSGRAADYSPVAPLGQALGNEIGEFGDEAGESARFEDGLKCPWRGSHSKAVGHANLFP